MTTPVESALTFPQRVDIPPSGADDLADRLAAAEANLAHVAADKKAYKADAERLHAVLARVRSGCDARNWPMVIAALMDIKTTASVPLERHWFVADATSSYCLACNLPESNGRHVSKAD